MDGAASSSKGTAFPCGSRKVGTVVYTWPPPFNCPKEATRGTGTGACCNTRGGVCLGTNGGKLKTENLVVKSNSRCKSSR